MDETGTGRRRSRLTLLLAIVGVVIVLGVALIVVLFVAVGNRPGLNPVEAVITRLSLAMRSAELARPLGSDPQRCVLHRQSGRHGGHDCGAPGD